MKACDFLVIGGGIAGASAAYELADHGSVVVLEREDSPGYHSTGRSAAQFLETYGNETVRRLTKASRSFFETPPAGFSEHPLLTPRQAMYIARDDQLSTLARSLADVRSLTASAEEISPCEARARVPVLRQDYVAGAFVEPHSMDIDVHALHQGYLRGVVRRGGEVLTNTAVARLARRGEEWIVETGERTLHALVVINAAGAWCDEIAASAGVGRIGLIAKRRTVITFDGPAGIDAEGWPLVADIAESFCFKPESGRILASPADESPVPPGDVQPEELDIAITVERIHAATTLRVRRIDHKWAGLRSFVPDKSPVVGMDRDADGFFWLAAQGGYGIQTSPAIARAVAGLVISGRLPDDLVEAGLSPAHLGPDRLDRV